MSTDLDLDTFLTAMIRRGDLVPQPEHRGAYYAAELQNRIDKTEEGGALTLEPGLWIIDGVEICIRKNITIQGTMNGPYFATQVRTARPPYFQFKSSAGVSYRIQWLQFITWMWSDEDAEALKVM